MIKNFFKFFNPLFYRSFFVKNKNQYFFFIYYASCILQMTISYIKSKILLLDQVKTQKYQIICIKKYLFKSKTIIGKNGKPVIVGKNLNQLNVTLIESKKFKDDIFTNYKVN